MASCMKTSISLQSSYTSLYRNPLTNHDNSNEATAGRKGAAPLGPHIVRRRNFADDKENSSPNVKPAAEENPKEFPAKSEMRENLLKPSSLQLCIKRNEPDTRIGLKLWDAAALDSEKSNSVNVWDYSDSESAPVSSWSNLPNRALLCRPLPVDVGRCTCIIVKESSPEGFDGGTLYTLYTNEGKGRPNRKLAVAHHRRRRGRSEFVVAQNARGIVCGSEDSLIGVLTSNIVGSKYYVWDQGNYSKSTTKQPKLLAAVKFMATAATWTGNYRSIKAWIPKHQSMSMQLKNTNQIQHMNGLPKEWEGNKDRVHHLFSKIPAYNKFMRQYELDYRDRGRGGLKIQSSVKNFQLILDRNGQQTILQLGRLGKSKYVMDYRYPLTGYQAFCMCLASMDSKLCCTV